MTDEDLIRDVVRDGGTPKRPARRHIGEGRHGRVATEDVVLLQDAEGEVPEEIGLKGGHGSVGFDLVPGVDGVEGGDAGGAGWVRQALCDAAAAVCDHGRELLGVPDGTFLPAWVDAVLDPWDLSAAVLVDEEEDAGRVVVGRVPRE